MPVAADLSDLHERIAWCRANSAACRAIAARGQEFVMARDFDSEMASAVERVRDAHARGKLRRTAACHGSAGAGGNVAASSGRDLSFDGR